MLNWKVRLKQKWFWLTLIPLLFLLADQVYGLVAAIQEASLGALYGSPVMTIGLEVLGLVFAVLACIGAPVDLTTEGYGDSARALDYELPAPNAAQTGEAEFRETMGEEDACN